MHNQNVVELKSIGTPYCYSILAITKKKKECGAINSNVDTKNKITLQFPWEFPAVC